MSKASRKPKKKIQKQKRANKQKAKSLHSSSLSTKTTKEKKQPLFKRYLKSTYFVIGAFITVASIPVYFVWFKDKIHEIATPKSVLFEEDNFIKGILIPKYILESNADIDVYFGSVGMSYPIGKYKQGVDVTPSLIRYTDGQNIADIKLKIMNNKLYVSTEINDIETGEIIGIINYNKWNLYKKNVLTYHDDNNSLEVIDKYNNVVFSIFFYKPNTIVIQGYFFVKGGITVVGEGIEPFKINQKEDAIQANSRSFLYPTNSKIPSV